MTALEKLAEERDEQKNARIDRILAAAFTLFSSAGSALVSAFPAAGSVRVFRLFDLPRIVHEIV